MNPTHTIPSLSGTFGIPARLALNPKIPKEPSSPSRSNAETERCNKLIINVLLNKGQLVTHNIKQLGFSGLRGFGSRTSIFLGGYECTPKTQQFHIVKRYKKLLET
jgi:hypothetical protein